MSVLSDPFDQRTEIPPDNWLDQALPGDQPATRLPYGPLIAATFGLLLVLFALLVLRWPLGGPGVEVGPHLMRITYIREGEPAAAILSRLILNIGIYIIVVVCAVSLLSGWLRGRNGAAQTMLVMAAMGLLYMAGMALYLSAAISICGFSLILFSALTLYVGSQTVDLRKRKKPYSSAKLGTIHFVGSENNDREDESHAIEPGAVSQITHNQTQQSGEIARQAD